MTEIKRVRKSNKHSTITLFHFVNTQYYSYRMETGTYCTISQENFFSTLMLQMQKATLACSGLAKQVVLTQLALHMFMASRIIVQ